MAQEEETTLLARSLRAHLEADAFFGLEEAAAPERPKTPKLAAASPPPPPPQIERSHGLFESPRKERKILPRAERITMLGEMDAEVRDCQRCRLCEQRQNAVPGEGNPEPRILFIGEGPGANEDDQGRPFVGRAGMLLNDIIEKGMGLKRADVFITNIVKCRPPGNREPRPDEVALCLPFLRRQIEILAPEVIVTLGRPATCTLLGVQSSMGRLRGRIHQFEGTKVIPTFHPAYLLRNPAEKKRTWEDIQMVMRELGLKIPGK